MTNTEVYQTIIEATAAYATSLGIASVAYPGKKFTPPDVGIWMQLSISPNDFDPDISGQSIIRRGIWQINMCAKTDTSILTLSAKVDDLIAIGPQKGVSGGGQALVITNVPRASSMIALDEMIIIPVTITYSE